MALFVLDSALDLASHEIATSGNRNLAYCWSGQTGSATLTRISLISLLLMTRPSWKVPCIQMPKLAQKDYLHLSAKAT